MIINPTNKFLGEPIYVQDTVTKSLLNNQILKVEVPSKTNREKLKVNNIEKEYGDSNRADLYSYLSEKEYGLYNKFPKSVIYELNKIKRKKSSYEKDLVNIPFVTIDPIDAKDRDDAIYANFPISIKEDRIFCEIWIAISDVSSFFEMDSQIDNEALLRGNSTYLHDFVIPMLPKEISNNLCSLEENQTKFAITLKITFDKNGNKLGHTFYKGKIKVKYNLNYEEVEEILLKNNTAEKEKNKLINNLVQASNLLKKVNSKSLAIKISEPKIINNYINNSLTLIEDKSLNSHKIVENFMIMANLSVGETLSKSKLPIIYRHHENPNIININKLNKSLSLLGFSSGKKLTLPCHFNEILNLHKDTNIKNLISIIILKNMSQAYYTSEISGHFGLSLNKYVHFTSPIRRYSDLLVHRLLHLYLGWSSDKKGKFHELKYDQISAHISSTERKSIKAERQTNLRYLASYMSRNINKNFDAIIYAIMKNKIFFFLKDIHIQGECLVEDLNNYQRKIFKRKKKLNKTFFSVAVGDLINVKLIQTNKFNGTLSFEYQKLIKKFSQNNNNLN